MSQIFNLQQIIGGYGYLGIFIIVFLESGILFALPGDSLLFTAGLLISVFHFNFLLLVFIIFLATFFGGVVGYEIGVYLDKLRKYSFFRKILKQEYIDRTHAFFDKHGKLTIFFSRFVPIIRTFTPIVAGIAEVEYTFFIKWSLLSSLAWSIFMTSLGYFLGQIFPELKNYLWVVAILVILVSIVPLIFEMLKGKKVK